MGEPLDEDRIGQMVLTMLRALRQEESREKDLRKEADEKRKDSRRLGKYLHELEKAVVKVSNHHWRRELDKEVISDRVLPPKVKLEAKEEKKVQAVVTIDDLSDLMKNLSLFAAQFMDQKGQL
ncbi:unnamed protein product [Calypogeia fissa]